MENIRNKVVIVTGASSGIGRALAVQLAVEGAKVVLAARNAVVIETSATELNALGYDSMAVQTDVTKEEDCRQLVEKTLEHYGCIDVLINNAGISMRALFEEVDLKVLHQLMDVNFWGCVKCCKYALPHILKQKGSIVGVSSIAGYKGLPARSGYSASKFAMQGFLEVIRSENRKKGLHVLIACPGFTASNIRIMALAKDGSQQGETPRNEGEMMAAEEVAARIIRAISKRKRSIIMTTDGILTVFLNKFFPAWVDKMVYNHMAKEADSPFK
ncbi:MAG: SDR family oxidoreductase [Bacteroidetes bacterium]|nr:SDR family oxidoreductase [Bacteroidota bacterium]